MIDRQTGVIFEVEGGHGEYAREVHNFASRNGGRLVDIFGDVVDHEVLPHVGWKFSEVGVSVILRRDDGIGGRCVGMAWALPTIDGAGKTRLNLTWAVDEAEAGQGLATLAASAVFVEANARGIGAEGVSAQTLRNNASSVRVACKLGLQLDPGLDFACETSIGSRDYAGFSLGYEAFLEKAAARVAERMIAAPGDFKRERMRG